MTVVAVNAARDMGWMLACRGQAVMTGSAGADHLGMVNGRHWYERDSAVAVFADICSLYMRRTLARRRGAIVAANAVVGDADMIECGRQPADRGVAIIALIAGGDMSRRFPRRLSAIVASHATAG